jgi:hypothetical protein
MGGVSYSSFTRGSEMKILRRGTASSVILFGNPDFEAIIVTSQQEE